ncbi:MAG: hypothetical protein IPJ20_15650 [Flammeovirgaceae bacterium]|nr:hypothetical protein [Flammeovirgaceae bacterium]
MKKYIPKIAAAILLAFGLLTLFLSTSIIFDLFDIRAKEGNYVLFIVWANFISSIIYLFAVYGFCKNKKWTTPILAASVLLLVLALIGLFIHIATGGIYETKTVGAMIFRISLTLIFTYTAYYSITKKTNHND